MDERRDPVHLTTWLRVQNVERLITRVVAVTGIPRVMLTILSTLAWPIRWVAEPY